MFSSTSIVHPLFQLSKLPKLLDDYLNRPPNLSGADLPRDQVSRKCFSEYLTTSSDMYISRRHMATYNKRDWLTKSEGCDWFRSSTVNFDYRWRSMPEGSRLSWSARMELWKASPGVAGRFDAPRPHRAPSWRSHLEGRGVAGRPGRRPRSERRC